MHWLPVETGPGPRVSSLSVQTGVGGWGGWRERLRKGRDEESRTQNWELFVFLGDAEPGLCRCQHQGTGLERSQAPEGRLKHQMVPLVPARKNGSFLKDRISDLSPCEQFYFRGCGTPFPPYQQWGNTGASGMHDSRKISPESMRINHSSSSSSAMPRAWVPGARADGARWMETMPLSKA